MPRAPVAVSGAPGDAEREQRIAALLQAYHGEVPGVSVAVCHRGAAVYQKALGYAELEARVPATALTSYRLASVSKQFTAAAVLLLVQEGRLSLQDPVRRWLPELPPATDAMTVRQLLLHRSGVIDYEELIPAGTVRPLRDRDVLALLAGEDRGYFAPGSGYRYSDSGYALLGLIVGRCAGVDFASFLRARIFAPLDMSGTVAYEEGVGTLAHRAFGYSRRGDSWVRTDQSLTSAVLGDGGIYSSTADLVRWDAALGDARLLHDSIRALAFAPLSASDDPTVHYGFGWRITGRSLWHSGESIGFRTALVRFPLEGFTFIVLTNRNGPEAYSIALDIAQLWLPGAAAVRATTVVVGPDPAAHLLS